MHNKIIRSTTSDDMSDDMFDIDAVDIISDKEKTMKIEDISDTDGEEVEVEKLIPYILRNKCVKGDKTFTHTLWNGKTDMTFKVKNEDYLNFLNVYTNEFEYGKYGKLCIMERPLDVGPLCLDYDIKTVVNHECIKEIDIEAIIDVLNTIITKYYGVGKQDLNSYIMTKQKPYYDSKKYSDGFHIMYPNLILEERDRYFIFEESKNQIIKSGILTKIIKIILEDTVNDDNELNGTTYKLNSKNRYVDDEGTKLNDGPYIERIIKGIFDSTVIKKNSWFMFGSGKQKPDGVYYYKIYKAYDYKIRERNISKISNVENAKLLSIRKPFLEPVKKKNNMEEEYKTIAQFTKTKEPLNVDKLFEDPTWKEEECIGTVATKIIDGCKDTGDISDPIYMAKKIVNILSGKRADPYDDWITVGWTLYNISPTLYPEFLIFSKKSKKYDVKACAKVWDDCKTAEVKKGYTIASLYMWAKKDAPAEFSNIIRENVNTLLETADIRTEFDVAKIVLEMYKHDYVCADMGKKIWYQFEGHCWKKISEAYTLGIKMSTEVAKEFAKLSASYLLKSTDETGIKSDQYVKKSTDLAKLISNLKKNAYKKKLIDECAALFFEEKFGINLDSNPNIIGFDNGVYDISNGIFRNGSPDDYLSFSVGYNYVDTYSTDHPDVVYVENFISSILPEKDINLYTCCYISSLLKGGNSDQKFMIWTGPGGNGKGTLIDLIDKTFGKYYGTVPVTLLTVKRKSASNATPELSDKKGVRVIIMQEPGPGDEIDIGYMKELTGQDKIMTRGLFCDAVYYVPQFKLIIVTNNLPEIPSNDGGTWRRIVRIDFTQSFVSNPTKQNEQKIDPKLRDRLDSMKEPFMWLLINKYFPKYIKHGLATLEPESVRLSTNKYRQESSYYLEFFEECIEISPKDSIKKDALTDCFKHWYMNAYNGSKVPPTKKLMEFFDEKGYKFRGNIVKGIKLRVISEPECLDHEL